MEQVTIKIGDQLQIGTEECSRMGIVKSIHGIQTDTHQGALIQFDINGYWTADYFYPFGTLTGERIDERRKLSGMPAEYVYKQASSFDWDLYEEDCVAQKKIVNAFIINFDMFRKQGRGLYVSSSTKGSGKTMLACVLANEIIKKQDLSVKFITVPDYITLVSQKDEVSAQRKENIKNADLLILDDIGAQLENKDWINTALFQLINRRCTSLLPTIFTSNFTMNQLRIEERIKDRIHAMSVPIFMPEKNIRWQQTEKMNKAFLQSVLDEN